MEKTKLKHQCTRCGDFDMIRVSTEKGSIIFCNNCGKTHNQLCECDFEKTLVIVANGTRRIWEICKKCKNTGNKNFKLKDFDLDSLPMVMNESRKNRLNDLYRYWEQHELKNISKYQIYLKSESWQIKRQQVIERDNGFCRRCSSKGTDVHHLHYNNIYNEDLNDLILLCRSCHEKAHNL